MVLDAIFFYFFALITLTGAVLTVTLRSAVHCAIALIVSLSGVAGLFLLQHAEFLFAVQIILYVGGIMVLFLFVIMLVNLEQAAQQAQFNNQKWVALACVGVLGAQAIYLASTGLTDALGGELHWTLSATPPAAILPNTETIADILFIEYLLPFELASVLLLAAVVGGVLMGKKRA
jgi:NADH-quinone oxidoreductase subunit J